jgi:hypothetical protein
MPIEYYAGGLQGQSKHFREEKNFFPMPGIEPQIGQPIA